MNKRTITILFCAALIAGCGGDGDSGNTGIIGAGNGNGVAANNGSGTEANNGSGTEANNGSGAEANEPNDDNASFTQASGTRQIWESERDSLGFSASAPGGLQITLDDNNMAVASWFDYVKSELFTSVTDGTGGWSAAQRLATSVDTTSRFALRTNAKGQRILVVGYPFEVSIIPGTPSYRAFFYTPSAGWSDAVPVALFNTAVSVADSDLTMNDDGTALMSVGGDPFGMQVHGSTRAELYQLSPDGAKSTGLSTVPMAFDGTPATTPTGTLYRAFFAALPQAEGQARQGYFFWQDSVLPSHYYTSLGMLGASLTSPPTSTSAAYSIRAANSPQSPDIPACPATSLPKAQAASTSKAVVVWGDAVPNGCKLMATRLTGGAPGQAQTDVLSVPGDLLTPLQGKLDNVQLFMDMNGNALLLWSIAVQTKPQIRPNPADVKTRYWWSQSLEGGAWSQPVDLAVSLGLAGREFRASPSVAMNRTGDAVLTAFSANSATKDLSNGRLSYSRFSFKHGWSSSKTIAAGHNVTGIAANVSINSSGAATAMYATVPCFNAEPVANNCSMAGIYIYQF